ncbi:MAG: ComEC/Rec2 family competence protein, partial [Pseudomonadota bacterium]
MRRIVHAVLQLDTQNHGPLIFALGMTLGAVWYFSIAFEPPLFALLAGSVLMVCVYIRLRSRSVPPFLFLVTVFVLGSAVGALSGKLATTRIQHATLDDPIGPVLVEGWVTRAEPAKRGVRLKLKVHAIDGVPKEVTPNVVRLTHIAGLKVEPGRFVRCWAVLRPPPAPIIDGDYAFDRQAWYGGLGAVGYVQGRCRGGVLGAPHQMIDMASLKVSQIRRQLAHHVRAAAGERAGGFAAALASGDRSFMSQADQAALRGSGLAHLLAISGLHMGIVGGLVYLILWRGLALIEPIALRIPVRKPAALAGLFACTVYLIISGASVSTQRAFVMAAIFFGAILIDRAALSLRSLAIAMIAIIALAPWSVLTPGYQMSFA